MKKIIMTMLSLSLCSIGISQIDTISNNIYQKNGNLGIGISGRIATQNVYGATCNMVRY